LGPDLAADPEGLSEQQAADRLQEHGPNRLPEARARGPLLCFLNQFHNLLIYMLLAASGVVTAVLSGRRAAAVERRAAELGIAHVLQGIDDKRPAFETLLARVGVDADATGYMGDELVDLPVMTRSGFACAPREAPAFVRQHAQYVAQAAAGAGAVREVCELVMQAQGTLAARLAAYLA